MEKIELKHGYKYINQKDKKWQKYSYAGQKPENNACGPFVLKMVLDIFTNRNVELLELLKKGEGKYYTDEGTEWEYFKKVGEPYGIKVEELLPDEKILKEAIKNGNLVILSQNNKLDNYWTTAGHYILLVKEIIKDGKEKYLVLDPASRERTDKEYDFDQIFIPCKRMWIISKN